MSTISDTIGDNRAVQSVSNYRSRFGAWKRQRPFWGGSLLVLSGLIIAIIPLDLALKFALVPTDFAFVGLIFAVFVVLSGVFALYQPQFAGFFGAAGILVAIISIFGALGGFVVGTLVGILGGSLCVAWEPPREESAGATATDGSATTNDGAAADD
ncbi:DUF6114 domain-containing protein [Halomarina litorea]|uniref:DUF6114 domain-containing protein n=1 Tax=Halomarina litorea TaxID=2961595 RepID=UPI0020C23C5C|nr:DUF6114 domain-containing protein [Halomarina sp. BCD28]